MGTTPWDAWTAIVAGGGSLADDDIREAAASPDILSLGMLADTARRAARGTRATYLRVATVEPGAVPSAEALAGAGEVRLLGTYPGRDEAVRQVRALAAECQGRPVTAWSLADIEADTASGGADGVTAAVAALVAAGLTGVAEAPLDRLVDAEATVAAAARGGARGLRLTLDKGEGDRLERLLLARRVAAAAPVSAVHPLPLVLNAFRPTTGYDDVRVVALARLLLPAPVSVQVDWPRYGPKLAQVALAFGADDVYGAPAVDEAPDGVRRGRLLEVRRNIEAAGCEPVERDGVFAEAAARA